MQAPKMIKTSPLYVLAAAVFLYLALLSPQFGKNIFVYDNFYNLWRAQKVVLDPLSIFEPTFATRFSPFYYLLLFVTHAFFGLNPFVYGLINSALHVLNAILLFRLIKRLMGESVEIPALLAAVFFLFSSTQWGVIWELGQTHRLACGSLSLSALLFFAKWLATEKKINWVLSFVFFVGSFGFSEDSMTLPLLLLAVPFLIPVKSIPLIKQLTLTGPFFAASLIYGVFSLSVGAPQGAHLHFGTHILLNLFSLTRELIQFLLIPRPEFVPFSGIGVTLVRLFPALLILLLIGVQWKWKFIDRFFIFGITWIGITSILYVLRPMPGVWQGRYLYFPGMGEAIVVGSLLYRMGCSLKSQFSKGCLWGVVLYLSVLNVSTLLFMIEKSRSGIVAATREELPVLFSITNAIRNRYGAPPEIPPDLILMVEGLPISIHRLEELLPTYYLTLPAMIVEAKEGRALASIRDSGNYRILYLKWQDGVFSA